MITKTDQSIYGCVAIELYSITHDEKYKKFADQIFLMLEAIDKKNGLICYRENQEQNVDLLGFVCPFLSEYGTSFNNTNAISLNSKLIDDYAKYGVDETTGIPSQAYNTITKVKVGLSNWGRGMSWYALALTFTDKSSLNDNTKESIKKFTNIIQLLNKNYLFTQFPGKSKDIDMSTTVPLLFYLYKENKLKINQSQFCKLLSNFVNKDGCIVFNSPSISIESKSGPNMCNDMTQGVLIYFFDELKNQKNERK